jgi:hypothetical protein
LLGILPGPSAPSTQALLRKAVTPAEVMRLGKRRLTGILRKASRGQLEESTAAAVLQVAEKSVGVQEVADALRMELKQVLARWKELTKQIREVEALQRKALERVPYAEKLLRVPGLGPVTVARVLGEAGDLKAYRNARALVKMAGLNRYSFKSGKKKGQPRITKRGRPMLRHVLYMAALGMTREGRPLGSFYERLREDNGVHKVKALVAASRKLLRALFAVVRDDVEFDETLLEPRQKSEVSRTFVARTEAQLAEFLQRPLDGLDLPVLLLDGLEVYDRVLRIALGIDRRGYKHVLGLWEGTTESEEVCRSLLSELVGRGLPVEQARLFVIDGGKGLRKAIRKVFGAWALIARCRVHKMRNVAEHLPKGKQTWVRTQMRQAFQSGSAEEAKRRLLQLAVSLEEAYPSAANSLREGLDETLTVLKLNVGPTLTATLSSTNPIENLNGSVRNVTRRVKRWRGGKMVMRWVASGLLEAAKRFRRGEGLPRDAGACLFPRSALPCFAEQGAEHRGEGGVDHEHRPPSKFNGGWGNPSNHPH